jgi:O-antigen/teichoic acid export membrane protein
LIPVLARTLGADGYGAFTQVWLTAQVLTPFISLSVENAVVQRVAASAGTTARESALGNALVMSAILGVLVLAAGITPLGPLLAQATLGDSAFRSELLAALVLAGLGGPIAIGLGYLQGLQKIEAASALHVCRSFASALIMIGVALAGFGLRSVMLAAIVADMAFLAVLYIVIRPKIRWRDVSTREIRWMASFALPFAAGNALYLALNGLPRFFLVHAMGLAAVAVFSASISLANPLLQVAGAVQYVIYPAATRQKHGEGISAAAGLVARSAAAVLCFASFALVGLCVLGPPILAALTGGRLTASPREFATIAYGMLFLGLYRVVVIYQLIGGHSKALLAPLTWSAIVVGLASWSLVPHAGAIGAAQAFLLGCASLLGHAGWQLRTSALAHALAGMRPLHVRAGLALLVPAVSVLVLPAGSLSLSLLYVALGLGAVAMIWFAFGGARLFRIAIAPTTGDLPSEACP